MKMKSQSSNILKGAVLLGCIAHIMIFMNGYWNNLFWMTAILSVGIPIAIHKFSSTGKLAKRKKRMPPKEL